jgi:hypothetical protein
MFDRRACPDGSCRARHGGPMGLTGYSGFLTDMARTRRSKAMSGEATRILENNVQRLRQLTSNCNLTRSSAVGADGPVVVWEFE